MTFQHRYDRNMEALTIEECRALCSFKVTVVGCGGLGGYVAEQLARIGVGHLRLIDADVFEESNLNRQLFSTEVVLGEPKVRAAVERLALVNSECEVETHQTLLTEENASSLVEGSHCVVDCLDNVASRFHLARACQEVGVPLVYGAIAGWFGQVCTVYPGDVSFATLYGAVQEGSGVQKQEGNLPFAAGTVASVQAAETVKVLLGKGDQLRNRLLMIDLLYGSVEDMPLK